MVYELLTGRLLFPGDSVTPIYNIVSPSPVDLEDTHLPEPVRQVLQQALAKDVNARFSTCAEFSAAFARAVQSSTGSDMTMADEQHYQQILEQLQGGQLALFIGADLPREITGLPSRADLARDLARRHRLDESLPLDEVTLRVGQGGSRFTFTSFIRDALDATRSPQPFHQGIVALVQQHHIETIITTAYDNLLELAFQQAGIGINRVVRGSEVNFIVPDRPTLIKLYGDAQQPDTLVVTDRDHSDLLRDRNKEALIDEVRQAFRRKTMLFLGYNLADPDFRFLFDQVAESKFARTAYAIWPGLPEVDTRMWQDRGIAILGQDPLGILDEVSAQPAPPACAEATAAVPQGATPLTPDTEMIRQLLAAAFSDEELTALCFDHFHPVYEAFGEGMTKPRKIQLLLEHCVRQVESDRLLSLVRERNPNQYNRFVARAQAQP